MPAFRASLVLLVVAMLLTACGSSGSDATSTQPRDKPTKAFTPEERAQARVSGTQSATLPAGFDTCLEAAGFSSAPPQHGVAAQWAHADGTVVAVSTDASQMATIAAQFSRGRTPADVLDGGVIIGGTAAAAAPARACAAGR